MSVNDGKHYNYKMVRVVCQGKIISCDFCKDYDNDSFVREGYCAKCGRPLWKKSGEDCGFIVAYKSRYYTQQNKVHIKCKYCNTLTTI